MIIQLENDFTNANEDRLILKKMLLKLLLNFIIAKDVPRVCEVIQKFPDLSLRPHGFYLFHILSLCEANNAEYILQCIESKAKFYLDFTKKTPLHYLLNSNARDQSRINAILAHSETLFPQQPNIDIMFRYFSSIFFQILKLDNIHVATFLKTCVSNFRLDIIPSFGRIKSMSKTGFIRCIYLHPNEKEVASILRYIDEQGNAPISLQYFRIPLNFSPYSSDMVKLLMILLELECDDIFDTEAAKMLIDYFWTNNKWFARAFAGCYSVSMVIFSIYAGLRTRILPMEIIDFILVGFMFICEIFQFTLIFKSYCKDLWKAIDFLALALRIMAYISIWNDEDSNESDWFICFALLVGYFKWISCLRLFNGTSKFDLLITEKY